jgi:thiol-disulfide isomerase/thioredoxin
MNFLTLLFVALNMEKKKRAKSKKRDLIELGIVLAIFATIYLTGAQTEVFGKVQQAVLTTGVMNASAMDEEDYLDASYDFKLIDPEGNVLDAAELKGKVIFMNIWATWCAPCVAEMPNINKLYGNVGDNPNIVFLMISHDKTMRKAVDWVKNKGFDFPIYQLSTRLPDVYETGVVPSTFVISPEGKVVVQKVGMANYNAKRFRKFITKLAE